jgi:hypothetical protein
MAVMSQSTPTARISLRSACMIALLWTSIVGQGCHQSGDAQNAATDGRCGDREAGVTAEVDSSEGGVSNDPHCPSGWTATAPGGIPATCTVNGLICTYPEGQAECAPDGAVLKWWTNGESTDCSETAPKVGSACGMPGLDCQYITGPPTSNFTTNYCCNGNSCAWSLQGGTGCPNGNTCGTIKASDYDQSCASDSDCVTEPEGDFCGAQCTNCPGAVISVMAQAQYEADLASKISMPADCPCPLGPRAVCNHGKCATALQ